MVAYKERRGLKFYVQKTFGPTFYPCSTFSLLYSLIGWMTAGGGGGLGGGGGGANDG